MVLAAGTTLAVLVMFAVQVPALLKTGWRHSWGLGLDDPALRRMLWLAVPTVIYVVTNLVAVSFRNASAFAVSPTGPSILTYAWIFYQLPYGILAVALATAVFTELADAAGRQDTEEFKSTFLRGLRTTGVLMLPTSALLIALATPLVSLYRVGAFKASDVPLVVGALRWWACGPDLLREHDVPAPDVLLAQGHAHAHARQRRAHGRPDRPVRGALHRHRRVARPRHQRHCPSPTSCSSR